MEQLRLVMRGGNLTMVLFADRDELEVQFVEATGHVVNEGRVGRFC